MLRHAWEEVAGATVARRVPALRISRGILEIEVPDQQWADAVRALLPRLAGRLAARYPGLSVRRFRLVRPGSKTPEAAENLPAAVEQETSRKLERARVEAVAVPDADFDPEERLATAMEHYLEAGDRKQTQKP